MCDKFTKRDYMRKWRKEHPEKLREYWKRYKTRHPKAVKKKRNYDKEHNQTSKRKNQLRLYQKEHRQNLRLEVLIHYGGNPPKCACCAESNIKFLTIDHINNDGYKEGRNRHIFAHLKRNNFPEGYQVLCYNCNCGRQYNNGVCPHKERSD